MYTRVFWLDRVALELLWPSDCDQIDRRHLEGVDVAGGESRSADYIGTKSLMVAVLDEATSSLLGRSTQRRSEAEFWIRSKDRRSPFAFVVVCETLGLEPEAVRKRLLEARDRGESVRKTIGRPRKNARRNLTRQAQSRDR